MTNWKSAALFVAIGFLLASLTSSPRAAPDKTLGMALMSASVGTGCSLAHGAGVTTVDAWNSDPNESCVVTFDRRVDTCTYAGVIGYPTYIHPPAGEMAAVPIPPPSGSGHSVRVYRRNSAGAGSDLPFHLMVFCAQ